MMRFGLFTDAHYAVGKQYGTRFCDRSLDKLRVCLHSFRARGVDFVVNLGDIINGAHDEAVDLANLAAVREVLDRSGLAVHHVLGNHDLESMSKARVLGALGVPPGPGAGCAPRDGAWYSFSAGGCRMLVLDANYRADGVAYDSGNYGWEDSYIPQVELEWLADELGLTATAVTSAASSAAAGRLHTFVFVHQNLDDRPSQEGRDPHVAANRHEVRAVLERADHPVTVFQGHYHPGLYQSIDAVSYVTLRAMCEGQTSEDNAWAVVTVDEAGARVEGFARQESYLLG